MQSSNSFDCLVIHVGLHKTGTTWIQRNIFERGHETELEYCGDPKYICEAITIPSIGDFSADAARDAFAPLLSNARRTGRLAVISCEELGGWPFHRRYVREIMADRLARTFPGAKLLITIREQRAIIYSIYGEYLRYGYGSTLAAFLAQPTEDSVHSPIFDRHYYDYERLFADYEKVFPRDDLIIMPVEWLLSEPDKAIARLSQRSGYPISSVKAGATAQPKNAAWSDLANCVLRQLNLFISQDSRWYRSRRLINPASVAYKVDRLTPKFMRRSMRARRIKYIDEVIGETYSRSNAAASKIIGIDLAQYGYRT